MRTRIYIALVLALISFCECDAQSLSQTNFKWQSDESINLIDDEVVEQPITFISTGLKKIELVTRRINYVFLVSGIHGSWDDISTEGEVELAVSWDDVLGVITIGRSNGQTYIVLDTRKSSPSGIYQKYLISSVTENM